MGFAYPFDLREISNGIALWLGIQPYELFFYVSEAVIFLDPIAHKLAVVYRVLPVWPDGHGLLCHW